MFYSDDSVDVEPIVPEEGSHEPLWKRNDPDRVQQIRGILLDSKDNSNFTYKSPTKSKGKYKNEVKCIQKIRYIIKNLGPGFTYFSNITFFITTIFKRVL